MLQRFVVLMLAFVAGVLGFQTCNAIYLHSEAAWIGGSFFLFFLALAVAAAAFDDDYL